MRAYAFVNDELTAFDSECSKLWCEVEGEWQRCEKSVKELIDEA